HGVRARCRLRLARVQACVDVAQRRVLVVRGRRARLHDLPPRLDRVPVRAHDRRGSRSRRVRARVRRGRLLDRAPARARSDPAMKLHRLLLPVAVLAVTVVAAGCGGTGNTAPVATTAVSMAKSYRFDPATIEIKAGQTVTWTNNDNFTHTVKV